MDTRRTFLRDEVLRLLQQECPDFYIGPWTSKPPSYPYLCARISKVIRRSAGEQSADDNNPHSGMVRLGQAVVHIRAFGHAGTRTVETELDIAIESVDMAMESESSRKINSLTTERYTLTVDSIAVAEEVAAYDAEDKEGMAEIGAVIGFTQIFQ